MIALPIWVFAVLCLLSFSFVAETIAFIVIEKSIKRHDKRERNENEMEKKQDE